MWSMKLLLDHRNISGKDDWTLRKPNEVGRFSLDDQRKFHHDRHQMSCYTPPEGHGQSVHLLNALDLNDGFETDRHISRNEDIKERLDNLLLWMSHNKERFLLSRTKERKLSQENVSIIADFPDFLLWRGHLTKFMCTPYENREGWMMACQKYEDTIYISEVETKDASDRRKNRSSRDSLMTYWGVRFEGYMIGAFPKPGQRPTAHKDQVNLVTNTNKAFCSVLRSRLNARHSLMYGAEVDCCHPVDVLNPPDCYVELKTSRQFSSRRQEENFYRYKALKWWSQSYLAGVPQITCGFRDDDGMVRSLENFSTLDLPNRASGLRNSWNPTNCLVFLDNLLQQIKELFLSQHVSQNEVVILSWNPKDEGVTYRISKSIEDKFLPDWYITSISNF